LGPDPTTLTSITAPRARHDTPARLHTQDPHTSRRV
jgi:hypothetical protein